MLETLILFSLFHFWLPKPCFYLVFSTFTQNDPGGPLENMFFLPKWIFKKTHLLFQTFTKTISLFFVSQIQMFPDMFHTFNILGPASALLRPPVSSWGFLGPPRL